MKQDPDVRGTLIETMNSLSLIDDPITGPASPKLVSMSSKLWPGDQWTHVTHTATTIGQGRRIEEYVFSPADGGTPVPVVLVVDGDQGRLYGPHAMVAERKPMLPIDPSIKASVEAGDFLDGYFEHLVDADLEASIGMFEADGYIQHSNGIRYQGPARLREDYTNMFKVNNGTIGVRFANVTDDGERRVFECVMPNGRPGIALYERGASGKIAAIRISM